MSPRYDQAQQSQSNHAFQAESLGIGCAVMHRRRAALMPADREECARLDKRIPVEEARLTNPDPQEATNAREALGKSRKRFGELRC